MASRQKGEDVFDGSAELWFSGSREEFIISDRNKSLSRVGALEGTMASTSERLVLSAAWFQSKQKAPRCSSPTSLSPSAISNAGATERTGKGEKSSG